jgi:two-component system, LuxR family, response regulator FixJ
MHPSNGGVDRQPRMSGRNTAPERFRTASVAVVDDDPQIRRALEHLLRTDGLHVMTFDSAEALLRAHPLGGGDCMILDVHLEGMSGLDLCQHLAERSSRVPIVFLTADTRLQRATMTRAVACLSKPVDADLLLATVHRALSESSGWEEDQATSRAS